VLLTVQAPWRHYAVQAAAARTRLPEAGAYFSWERFCREVGLDLG
jgi:hypothetical protein